MSTPNVSVRPWRSFAFVTLAYAAALVAAGSSLRFFPADWHPLVSLGAADVVATVVIFVFSVLANNTSVYDPYWSVVPPIAAAWLIFRTGMEVPVRSWVVLALTSFYGVRLTWNWARGWTGLGHEDWRYSQFRGQLGKGYWPFSFFALHFFPTVMVWLGLLPLHAALVVPTSTFGALDVVAAIVGFGAVIIETVADEQLRNFRLAKRADGDICNVGLWAFSRHPNYFGEISFWVSLWLFGLAAGTPYWGAAGAVAMVGLFAGASIPMAEKRSLTRRPHYAEHQKRVSMLVPWFPRKTS
jgi:steroid 5-alpha reductase family enzyme